MMKKHLKAISAMILAVASLAACNNEKIAESYITPDRVSISDVDAQSPVDEAIILKTNTLWMVLDVPSWLTVSPMTGYGDAILTVTVAPNFKNENTESFLRSGQFRIVGNANSTAHQTGVSISIDVAQLGFTPVIDPSASIGGIPSLEEFLKFAETIAGGGSTSRWLNADGEVELKTDIDLSSESEWTPIGIAKMGSAIKAEPAVETCFTGVFNGGGHSISGINWSFDVADASKGTAYGLFGAAVNATIKNLILGKDGDAITVTGAPSGPIAAAALVAIGDGLTVIGVTNNVDMYYDCNTDPQFAMAGIVARGSKCVIGGTAADSTVVNNGDIIAKSSISLAQSGEGGHMTAGIQGYMYRGSIKGAKNNGTISCASGRSGGIVASINNGATEEDYAYVYGCTNSGTVRRDLNGNATIKDNNKRMGGIFGGAEGWYNKVENCVNEGNVFAEYLCRCGGCCGHAKIQVIGFENKGIVLSDADASHGPGWISGYFDSQANAVKNNVPYNIHQCKMGGKVGSWTEFKDKPSEAPAASIDNVLGYNNKPDTQFLISEIIQ